MTNATDALQRAISYLGAVKVAEDRWAYKPSHPHAYVSLNGAALELLAAEGSPKRILEFAETGRNERNYWCYEHHQWTGYYVKHRNCRPLPERGGTALIKRHGVVLMPSWWTLEERFAWRIVAERGGQEYQPNRRWRCEERYEAEELALIANNERSRLDPTERETPPFYAQRITADLETGEELPA